MTATTQDLDGHGPGGEPVTDLGDAGVPGEPAADAVSPDAVYADDDPAAYGPGIDPERLALCLAVLGELDTLPVDHPDAIAVRRATAGIYRTVKQRRRQERRAAKTANDKAVTEATATGAADRIDDETLGIQLTTSVSTEIAGILERPRSCYVCKTRYIEVDAFYHQLCPSCAAENRSRRDARTDLTGRRALLTGGRAKIGMYIALRLLRDGAHTTITTRFPNDAVRRFKAMPDSADWMHRLKIVGIDLRDPAQVVALADSVAAAGPLDILINNAAQTVRRSPAAYRELVGAEAAPLPAGELPATEVFGAFGSGAQTAAALPGPRRDALTAQDVTDLALVSGSASLARIEAGTAIDAGGLVPDLDASNTWVQTVGEVDPVELLEVQLCNVTAPFVLVSRLRPAMAAAAARRKYVVNVSAMEGQFSRGYKGPGHPHTNMAKAALNMLTRTSAQEMLDTDGILMTAVDTGWITDERPHPDKIRLAAEGFHAPLDLVDGAARVYDPIVRGEQGEDLFGCFLKDYAPSPW
ncbi:SDR family NAD(P)-dependent oxidoreductase [Actinacidiphila alni]|uniref:SDR family NAD(P)-dependent oxidoreductase n=1 Tax=Actinacidiphila alni TaxID=380248 RepID=UPI0033C585BB